MTAELVQSTAGLQAVFRQIASQHSSAFDWRLPGKIDFESFEVK
jgi:hypothetical protein